MGDAKKEGLGSIQRVRSFQAFFLEEEKGRQERRVFWEATIVSAGHLWVKITRTRGEKREITNTLQSKRDSTGAGGRKNLKERERAREHHYHPKEGEQNTLPVLPVDLCRSTEEGSESRSRRKKYRGGTMGRGVRKSVGQTNATE